MLSEPLVAKNDDSSVDWKEREIKQELGNVISHAKDTGTSDWNSKNPEGLTENVSEFVETPDAVLKRLLLEGEEVVQQFDCYFPGVVIPKWKIAQLIIRTLGLYLIVLAYRELVKWCYKNRCCTPNTVEMARGKVR